MVVKHNKKFLFIFTLITLAITTGCVYIVIGDGQVVFQVLSAIAGLIMLLLIPFLVMCLFESHAIVIEKDFVKFSRAYGKLSFPFSQVKNVKLEVKQGYMHQIKVELEDEEEWRSKQNLIGRFHVWMNRTFARTTLVIASSLLDFSPFDLEKALKKEME